MTEPKPNTKNAVEMPALGIKLTDIYYVLFRKKWLIAGFFAAGLIIASIVFFAQRALYWSEAKLLVRYVIETKSMDAVGSQVKQSSYGGESVINSELEILTSFDLCVDVATLVGPEKILGKNKDGSNVMAAAVAVYRGLTVENPRRSDIIKVRFVHPDPQVPDQVLRQIIESYFTRHKLIHRSAGQDDLALLDQKTKLLNRIRATEKQLGDLKSKAGIISLDESKRSLGDQLNHLRQDIFMAEALLEEYHAIFGTNSVSSTNTEKEAADIGVPPEKISEYKSVCAQLENARGRELELATQYTDENPLVKRARERIADAEKKKKALEAEHPKLAALYVAQPVVAAVKPGSENRLDPSLMAGLQMKINRFTNQLATVREEIKSLENVETSILDVERNLELDKKQYMLIATGLAAAEFEDALSGGKISNIRRVQDPSPPAPNVSQRVKMAAGLFFGFLFGGIALAFIIELFVDHRVRRPAEFETKLHLPLFLSIPKFALNGHASLLPLPAREALPPMEDAVPDGPRKTWAADHPLRPYIDGLRDRTLIHFEGDPHKPKLIGLTSCGDGVGVTSLAAGLAGALSETGDGNVLLLNLNFESQSVHPFYRGELACDLSDVLETEKRRNSPVLQHLYVATAGNPGDSEAQNLSKQLARVVPKLRVSDYEYIIFDLPPTTPITMTARLAGMMDLVILVVESEKDTQESVKQVAKLLSRSKARVSAVLNKVRNPVPKWLHKGA
jgi:uncharacterized protein involved in exopolysaccharide biosynthesis/Mrp family chromosome partitioning ATPase